MPVIPDIDPQTAPLDEMLAYLAAAEEHQAIIFRNVAVAKAMIDRGQTELPTAVCPHCPGQMQPVRDDDTIECPTHGVIAGQCPQTMGHDHAPVPEDDPRF